MIYAIFAILLILIGVDCKLNKRIFTPGILFNGIFFITLLLYNFYLSDIQQVLSMRLLTTFLLSIIAFNIPTFIFYLKNAKSGKNTIRTQEKKIINLQMSKKKELIIFLALVSIFILEVIYNKGFPLLWKLKKENKVYVNFGVPMIHVVFVSAVTIMGAYSLFKKRCYYKYFYLAIGLLIINRNLIITIIVEGLIFFLLQNPNFLKNVKNLCIIVACGILVMIVFSVMGNFRTGENTFLNIAQFKESCSWIPTSIKWVYSYMCFSVSNLNNLFSMTNGGVYHGILTIKNILPTVLANKIKTEPFDSYLVSNNFTVSTFADGLYLDFGPVGIIIYCLMLGALCSFIYSKSKQNDRCKLAYSVLSYCVLFLFFINMLFYSPVYFQFIWIILLFSSGEELKNLCTFKFLKKNKISDKKSEVEVQEDLVQEQSNKIDE